MRADARAKRHAVLEAARQMFAQHGPNVALTTIAEHADVGIGTLYRHFPARADLLYAIAEEFQAEAIAVVETCLSNWESDPLGLWQAFVRQLAALRLSALSAQLAVPAVIESLPPEALRLREHVFTAVDSVLAKAKMAALVSDDVSTIRFLTGLAAITRPLPQYPAAILPAETDWIISTYLHGLRPMDE